MGRVTARRSRSRSATREEGVPPGMGEDRRADDDLAAGVPLAGLSLFPRSQQGQPGVDLGYITLYRAPCGRAPPAHHAYHAPNRATGTVEQEVERLMATRNSRDEARKRHREPDSGGTAESVEDEVARLMLTRNRERTRGR